MTATDATAGCPPDAKPDSDLPPLPPAHPGRYRHYKGGDYDVVGVARHSETLEPLVLYRPRYNATGLWVRPYDMFFGDVDVDGRTCRRFAPLDVSELTDAPVPTDLQEVP